MVVTLTPSALEHPAAWNLERIERLARQADHFTAEPDPIKPGCWIVRNPKVPYRIELVDAQGECSCRKYQLWDRCRHSALVMSLEGAPCR